MGLTKQGVLDLGGNGSKPRPRLTPNMLFQCDHRRLRSCCKVGNKSCGHILCPDCDLFIDNAAELWGKWIW